MKKLLLLAALVASTGAYSRTLTPEEALQRAYAGDNGRSLAPAAVKPTLKKTVKSENGTPAVYLFSTEADEWMAVSASDAAAPLLGYGPKQDADGQLPPQMEWWLNEYARQIEWGEKAASAGPERLTEPKDLKGQKKADRAVIKPLMTTTWNQTHPYNVYTPDINGTQSPTGCVATAMAQVMKYHNYPESGSGIVTATTEKGQTLQMSLEGITLNWDLMRDSYWGGDDIFDADIDAVGRLMQVAGYACGMNYGQGESQAKDMNAIRAFVDNFNYSPTTWLYYRDHYTIEDWEDMVYEQLAERGPVYYSGQSNGGGHAFVCDGYAGGGYFHINWGWGGMSDGDFLLDALDPDLQGTGGHKGGYNHDQVAVLGMQKPTIGAMHPAPQLSQTAKISTSISGGNPVITAGWFNRTYRSFTFSIGFEVKNTETGETDVFTYYDQEIPSNQGYTSLNTNLSRENIPDGNYRISLVTRTEDYPEWQHALAPVGMKTYGRFVKKNGVWQEDGDRPLELLEASAPEQFYSHLPSTYSVTLKNSNEEPTSVEYAIYLVKRSDSGLSIVGLTDGPTTFTVAPNSTETFETPFAFSDLRLGFEYDTPINLMLVDPKSWVVVHDFGLVTVIEPTFADKVIVTPDTWSGMEGDAVQLDVTFVPESTTLKEVEWTSSNTDVARVDGNGLVTTDKAGTCIITATAADGHGASGQCVITAVSSVEEVIDNALPVDIYGADGKIVMRQASAEEAKTLPSGLYIIRQGSQSKTILLTK